VPRKEKTGKIKIPASPAEEVGEGPGEEHCTKMAAGSETGVQCRRPSEIEAIVPESVTEKNAHYGVGTELGSSDPVQKNEKIVCGNTDGGALIKLTNLCSKSHSEVQ
jgi:hypothetical protein